MREHPVLFPLQELAKKAMYRLGLARTSYDFAITPGQMLVLMEALRDTDALPGDVIEVGVARGKTTLLLNKFLDEIGSSKKYFAVDTFGGFVAGDVDFEKVQRGKKGYSYRGFSYNDVNVWRKVVVERNALRRVVIIAQDIKTVEFDEQQRFTVAFLDVDLYLPTRAGLAKLWPRISPGGVVVVDDVSDSGPYDGANQAFDEFVSEHALRDWEKIPPKCGILRKA
jgi:O-methyltransferase